VPIVIGGTTATVIGIGSILARTPLTTSLAGTTVNVDAVESIVIGGKSGSSIVIGSSSSTTAIEIDRYTASSNLTTNIAGTTVNVDASNKIVIGGKSKNQHHHWH
jgi:hypothetical protein